MKIYTFNDEKSVNCFKDKMKYFFNEKHMSISNNEYKHSVSLMSAIFLIHQNFFRLIFTSVFYSVRVIKKIPPIFVTTHWLICIAQYFIWFVVFDCWSLYFFQNYGNRHRPCFSIRDWQFLLEGNFCDFFVW